SSGSLKIPPPSEAVQSWPLIGGKVYAFWHQASTDLSVLIENNRSQLTAFAKSLLGMAAGAGIGILQFIISILIAAAFLANAEAAGAAVKKLARRLNGEQGERLITLSVFTIRSVAGGLLGIAVFQALLAGIGMAVIDVPAAGLLALGVLMLCIAQIPPILLLGPVAFYVFSVESSAVATVFLIWCLVVNFADLVLKPMLLGRGVDVPMLVILLGAIGGMIMSGIVGLFVGAVVLALGYKLFDAWVQGDASLVNQDKDAVTDQDQP
ncbi:MAG: AI-2E family transporter, partial [Mariprofundus sp.]